MHFEHSFNHFRVKLISCVTIIPAISRSSDVRTLFVFRPVPVISFLNSLFVGVRRIQSGNLLGPGMRNGASVIRTIVVAAGEVR